MSATNLVKRIYGSLTFGRFQDPKAAKFSFGYSGTGWDSKSQAEHPPKVKRYKDRKPICGFLNRNWPDWDMRDEEKLLLLGPGAVFIYVLAERVCAHALVEWPTSSFIWYLNLHIFRPLHRWESLFPLRQMPGESALPHSAWIAASLLVLVCLGLLLKNKLPSAIAAHVALLYSGLILCCSWLTVAVVPIARFELWTTPNFVIALIFVASFISATTSHRLYWREILS